MAQKSQPLATVVPVRQDLSLADPKDPRSIINLVPSAVKEALDHHLFEKEELFNTDERELYKYLRANNYQPSPTDNRLRLKFWMEYDRVQERGEGQMQMVNVLAGICSREFFYKTYIKNPQKMAWMLCPPAGYQIKTLEALEFGIDQLRDILDIPHIGSGGKVDVKLAELKAKIVGMLDTRVKGAIVQKSMNLNVNTSNDEVAKVATAETMVDLQRQLKDLERRNRQAQNLPLVEVMPAEKKK
jgi:hypothetical protein